MTTDWRLTLPARTPYDRELLLQCIRSTVTRWGSVRVAVGGSLLLVDRTADADAPCPRCGGAPGRLHCRLDGTPTCLRCALACADDADAVVGVGLLAPVAPRARRWTHSAAHSTRGDAARPSSAQRRQ
jgi:hypothetical protein